MKHTAGPWEVIPKGNGFPDRTITGPAPDSVTEARYMPIATVHTYKNTTYPCFYEVPEEERDANARLIAAAPALYDLVKRLAETLEGEGLENLGVVGDAEELIYKVEGQ